MTTRNELGDRMKLYETAEAGRMLMPLLPAMARVDGRTFHPFTHGMDRPFDARMQAAMIATAMHLAMETNASMAYTQSDEITLAWHSANIKSQIWFAGRVSKMTSQLAAHATLAFYREIVAGLPEYAERLPTFDARVWNVPNRTEAANVFVWREQDATRNSIMMAAQTLYSHKQLHGKNTSDMQEMLFEKGVNWNDYPVSFKRGVFIQRRIVKKRFNIEELDRLPAQHEARRNPDLIVERSEWRVIELPPFTAIWNREDVIFCGAIPTPY